jgi:hypothetical protein
MAVIRKRGAEGRDMRDILRGMELPVAVKASMARTFAGLKALRFLARA